MGKTIEQNFADWECDVFGFGYGSGEQHTTAALKTFFSAVPLEGCYDYKSLEEALTPTVAWLLINTLCHQDVIEYGTSPRFGWLTQEGKSLKTFVDSKTLEELLAICSFNDEDASNVCYPNACNCGPGYVEGAVCQNPFWRGHHP